jgi:hypothetical protein
VKGGTRGEQKQRWRPWRRKNSQEATSTHGVEGIAAGTKPEKKRDRKSGEGKQHNRVYGAEPDSASQHKEAVRERKETARTLKELGPIDDHGFQLFDSSKVKPSGKPAPRKAVDPDPIETDDMGFEVYIPPAKVTSINKLKEHQLSLDTTQYTAMVDPSTPQSLRKTLSEAGDTARVDAGNMTEKASDLRRTAAALEDKPGMSAAAASMLREAAALDDTAEARLGMAAGFENEASKVPA